MPRLRSYLRLSNKITNTLDIKIECMYLVSYKLLTFYCLYMIQARFRCQMILLSIYSKICINGVICLNCRIRIINKRCFLDLWFSMKQYFCRSRFF